MTKLDLTSPSWVGKIVVGRYELLEVMGSGRTSDVFRARDQKLERVVAVKVLHPRLVADAGRVERFRGEARVGVSLSHKNIVTVIAQGDHAGDPYIVFEYVDGMTLRQLLQRAGRLPVERALEIAIGIAEGLAFAHVHGYVHLDVKPENVLLNSQGTPKLVGFGVARPLEPSEETTECETGIGSSDYMAPEQAQGLASGPRSDVYSLGVILYELLTGELPFSGQNFVSVAMQHVYETSPLVSRKRPNIPPRLDRAISKALAKNPGDRFSTMDVFARELGFCRDESSPGARLLRPSREPAVPRPWREPALLAAAVAPRSRRRGSLAALLFLLVLVVAGGALAVSQPWRGSHHKITSAPKPAPRRVRHVKHHHLAPPAPLPRLREVAAYDPPPGDGAEQNAELPYATDGQLTTAWSTEWYHAQNLGGLKPGVGIVLDADKDVRLQALTIQSDTPGFTAVVKTGSTPNGPFRPVSRPHWIGRRTTIALRVSRPGRYYLIWITGLPADTAPNYHADVNEVRATRPPGAPRT